MALNVFQQPPTFCLLTVSKRTFLTCALPTTFMAQFHAFPNFAPTDIRSTTVSIHKVNFILEEDKKALIATLSFKFLADSSNCCPHVFTFDQSHSFILKISKNESHAQKWGPKQLRRYKKLVNNNKEEAVVRWEALPDPTINDIIWYDERFKGCSINSSVESYTPEHCCLFSDSHMAQSE